MYKVSVIVLVLLVFSCQRNTVTDNGAASISNELSISETALETPENQEEKGLSPLKVEKEVTGEDELKKIHLQNADIDAEIYAFEEGYSFLKYNDVYFPLEFNYTYDADFESAVDNIQLFKSKKNARFYLILPSYTEEFETYQLLILDEDGIKDQGMCTFSTKEFEKSLGSKGNEEYMIFEKENNVLLSLFKGETKISFDVVFATEEDNSKKLESSDLEKIQGFN